MQLIGLARLGRDAEIRQTQSGPVANLSLAFNYGRKGEDGKRPVQWIDGALWGKRAEALIDYLAKGTSVMVTLDDPHIETFEGRDGPGHKLVATVSAIEFAGGGQQQAEPRQQAAPRPAQAPTYQPQPQDFDDDIPF